MTDKISKVTCSVSGAFSKTAVTFAAVFTALFCFQPLIHFSFAEDDIVKSVLKKNLELKEKEERLNKEDERLRALKKDVDERIEKYSVILSKIETVLNKAEQIRDEKLDHIIKTYEAMPPEEAAQRLGALNRATAVKIMAKMKSKKASAILASMEAKTVAVITESILKTENFFPAR